MTPQELKSIMSHGLLSFPLTDFDAEGNFKLNFTDRLTGETLSVIVSKSGHITAKALRSM